MDTFWYFIHFSKGRLRLTYIAFVDYAVEAKAEKSFISK